MTASAVLATLADVGVTVRRVGDGLRAAPRDRVTADLVALLREHKAELLALLEAEASPIAVGDLVDALDPALVRLFDGRAVRVAEVAMPAGGGGAWVGLRAEDEEWACFVAVEHVSRAPVEVPASQRELVGIA